MLLFPYCHALNSFSNTNVHLQYIYSLRLMPRTHWATFKLVCDSLYPCVCHIAQLCYEIVRHYIFVASIGRRLGITDCMTLPRRDPEPIGYTICFPFQFILTSHVTWRIDTRETMMWDVSLFLCLSLSAHSRTHKEEMHGKV